VSRVDRSEAGVPVASLAADDVVVFRNPWAVDEPPAFGVVVTRGAEPRVVSPAFRDTEPRLARGLRVERVLDAVDLLGVDAAGDTHLVYRDPLRVRWGTPGALDDCYPLAERGRDVSEWIRHVDRKRGWETPGRRVRDALDWRGNE
jgi:hypothetical protein